MVETTHGRLSFAGTLNRIEALEATLAKMFEPAVGWEWWGKPSDGVRGSRAGTHVLTLSRPSSVDESVWERYLAVYVNQGGGDGDSRRECRPVAYDREGRRYELADGDGGSTRDGDSGGWVEAQLFELDPTVLRNDDVAFLGIEAKQETRADDDA